VNNSANGVLLDSVELRNDLPVGLNVYSDPLIVKVFFNLIENALRHGGNISRIRFSFEECNGNGIIVCEDNGTGIPSDEKERVFIRGFGKNTGFGLAISRDILDITGITIRETGMPGIGARFEIIVPKKAYQIDSPRKNVEPGTP
jgi:signal transduction histidine kinase